MGTYKQVQREIPKYVGVYVLVPVGRGKIDEWNDPTPLTDVLNQWSLVNVNQVEW